MAALRDWRGLFACRVCWKIAAAVFALILAIESVILVPSAQRHERHLLALRVDQAIIAIEPTLAAADYGARAALLVEGVANSVGMYGLTGIVVTGRDGAVLAAAGETSGLERAIARAKPMGEGAVRSADGSRLDVAWPGIKDVTAAARMDTSAVAGEVLAYSLRVAGLVALIVLVVTAGTMLVLHGLLLRPVLRLRESSRRAAQNPGQAEQHVLPDHRKDEIGELIAAHNALLEGVSASARREREIAEERARYLSHHDALTGLPNRAALLQHLERLRRGDAAGAVSLFLIDQRQFKVLNASYGNARVDALLRVFSGRLRQVALPGDFIAHFGADRFALLRANGEFAPAKAAEIAERILATVCEGYELDESARVSLAVRIGIASAPLRALDGLSLVNEAELALARTRGEHAARVEFYSPEFGEQARAQQLLTQDLERGVAAGELFPVLQPKMALDSGGGVHLAGAEVLVRWKHPRRGLVSPGEFIPLAEASGLVVPIGERVLADTCALLRDWLDRAGWAPRLAVNLSARQFALPDLDLRLQDALARAGVAPGYFEVEVTESAAMKDAPRSAATLQRLRSLGVKVSIDDFGTGYSSLAYLRRFAVDAIKIDKSFVDDIGVDESGEAICDAVLRLGQALGCKVVAEGVETESQVSFLRRRRCDEVQGYYFGRPVAAAEFESRWISAAQAVAA